MLNEITVCGTPEGYDAKIILDELNKKHNSVIHVARDDKRMRAMSDAIEFFSPEIEVFTFPSWDCLPYDRVSPNLEISSARMAVLSKFAENTDRNFIVLTTLNAVLQKVPSKSDVQGYNFKAEVGRNINERRLREFLLRMGFTKSSTVREAGEYAIRGGIIDIFPPGYTNPVRLDLFGAILDGARLFDPETQLTIKKLNEIELAPVSEVVLDEISIKNFRQAYRSQFGASFANDPLYESVSAGRKYQGLEHWLPFFYMELDTFFSYVPSATITMDHKLATDIISRCNLVADQYEARNFANKNKPTKDYAYKPVKPSELYLDENDWKTILKNRRSLVFHSLPQALGPNIVDVGGRIGRNFTPERQSDNFNLFSSLADHIKDRLSFGPVLIASYSEGSMERLSGLIEDEGLQKPVTVSDWSGISQHILYLSVWPLDQGFETSDLTVISEQDILGDRLIRRPKKRRPENFLTDTQELNIGGLVVHIDHGIGRYIGLEVLTVGGAAHECLLIEYAESSRLYLPVENIDLLTSYGHEEGLLDRLGGAAWQAKKAKLKDRIKDMAEKLIRVAAERSLRRAQILEPVNGIWEAFSARFPYEETDDQLEAIRQVIDDLGSGRPMDRLICGDVGFGKTEVAMRAAFVTAMSGLQVALIAPTTLLARQHKRTFEERFRGFPLEVRGLSRFQSVKSNEQTREELSSGLVDIVIGTHAVLANSVNFKNLGLLIIDEEQHFGVRHKERLKQLKSDVHVLTLTATPIPRTLQLSLSGVRDLSIIGTPPVDRLAIRTYVSEFDAIVVREALLREHYRGGQSFFVAPRISDLQEIESFLTDQIPEISFITAHGQMSAPELDERMNHFYDGKFDVLVATSIVESGLDIPRANTLIVSNADMFGLAQLYQIRGRIGRSKTRAFAFLTTKPRKQLTKEAEKRLKVIASLSTLGAGFTLASQDLDIRGAGNLLGDEQSGQIRDVGYELYQSMLDDALDKMRAGKLEGLSDIDDTWAPQINLGVPVLIPESYVSDLDTRLGLYRRLSSLTSKVELEGFAAELIDRFGELPKEVNTLLLVVRIKAMCKRAYISKLDGGPKGATIQFYNDKFKSPSGLVKFINDENGLAKIRNNKLVVIRDWLKDRDRIKGSFSLAKALAKLAQEKN